MRGLVLVLVIGLAGCSKGSISDGTITITSQEQRDYIFGN